MKSIHAWVISLTVAGGLLWGACNAPQKKVVDCDEIFAFAGKQTRNMLVTLNDTVLRFPRTINEDGSLKTTKMTDWTSGFFPGNLWYLYEYTQDSYWKEEALRWTQKLEPIQYYTNHHDVGFMVYCSYGNGYRILGGDEKYKEVLVNTAKSLCTRFIPDAGVIRSWNPRKSRKGNNWGCPVIIDNMMNLELLFFASKATGDDYYKKVAVSHAEKTMENHFREDFGSYHVVNYDTLTGVALDKATWQGYADNSTWSRGQAWGIYGYTMTYRETKDAKFLDEARKLADFFIHNASLPEDKIPLWDFNAGQEGYVSDVSYDTIPRNLSSRDVSAAAITCSALIELSSYTGEKGKKYLNVAEKMLQSMSSSQYTAALGENGNFILKHFVGSFPAGIEKGEIDKPSVYADYYYLEALLRYKRLLEGKPVV